MFQKKSYAIESIRNFFKKLSLRKKIFFIFDILLLIVTFLYFNLLQYTSNAYDHQLIENTSHLLDLYSTTIENELQKVRNMTLTNLSSKTIQSNLLKANDSRKSLYEKIQAFNVISNYLKEQASAERYISSITVISSNGENRTVGNSAIEMTPSICSNIRKKLEGTRGSLVWIGEQKDNRDIIAARLVRTLNSLNEIGTLVYRINVDTLVDSVSTVVRPYSVRLAILSNHHEIIYLNNNIDRKSFLELKLPEAPNSIVTMQGQKYLLSRVTSNSTNWTYLYLLPYKQVFQNTIVTHTVSIVLFFLLFLLMNLVCFYFSDSITKPILSLSKRMRSVQHGRFNIKGISRVPDQKCDEVGQLNNDFILMIEKINELINENYVKQILTKESQLKALQAQIHPHFLYNTLDSIYWMAKSKNELKIASMVQSLANLLRSSISKEEDIITLKQELGLLDDYINIQKIRFEDRLDYRCDIDASLYQQLIPRLTLQPIVENSIKHCLEKMTQTCTIQVTAETAADSFIIVIRDNGMGITPDKQIKLNQPNSRESGIGLANISERIRLFYGDPYGMKITGIPGEGTCVSIRLPHQAI